MNTSQHPTIGIEIYDLLQSHLGELAEYGVQTTVGSQQKLEQITDTITTLLSLIELSPSTVTFDQFESANQLFGITECFFRAINATHIFTDNSTALGKIYCDIRNWCDNTLQYHPLSIDTVWNMIEPALPDTLTNLGNRQYEACWWTPVPQMDIEIFKRTPGIEIIEGPYTPEDLSDGIGYKFVIYEART